MTTTVAKVVADAGQILQDTGATRWGNNELLSWVNDGQRELVTLKPEANTKISSVALVAGTRQTLPTDGVQFFRVIRNMGTAPGNTPGRAVRNVDLAAMDAQSPDWHSATATAVTTASMFDAHDPLRFYVHPPSNAAGFVEVLYSAYPADCTLVGNLNLPDAYAPAILYYVLFRCYAKDAEFVQAGELAARYYALFRDVVGVKAQTEASRNPNAQGA